MFGQEVDPSLDNPVSAGDLDTLDRQLIPALVADGRATYADLAPLLGLSQAAVRSRVQRLIDERIAVIQAYAMATALGIGQFAGTFISVKGKASKVVEKICAMPEATLVAATSGRYNLIAEIWCRDNQHLLTPLDTIRSKPGVGVVAAHPYLEVTKEEYRVSALG